MRKCLSWFCAFALALYLCAGSPSVVASQAGKAYAEADDRLNRVYRELVATVRDAGDRSRLTTAAQAWIKFRDTEVNFYGRYSVDANVATNKSVFSLGYISSMSHLSFPTSS